MTLVIILVVRCVILDKEYVRIAEVTLTDGTRITFVGVKRPCPYIVERGFGARVMIKMRNGKEYWISRKRIRGFDVRVKELPLTQKDWDWIRGR